MQSNPMLSQWEQVGRRPSHRDLRLRQVSQANSVLLRFGLLLRSSAESGDIVEVSDWGGDFEAVSRRRWLHRKACLG